MIRLLTGKPGGGKTTYGLVLAKAYKDEGREVYVHGIKDLDYDRIGFKPLPEPTKWQDLPDGSVVVIDECYSTFPNRNPGAKVPDHVDAMARHRHRGFDFILMAQQGLQLDPFLRGLYDTHEHLIKKFGKKTRIKRWDTYEGNAHKAPCSDARTWLRPDWPHQFFTSTVVDTSKLHVPMWLRLLLVAAVIMGGLLLFFKHRANVQFAEAKAKQESALADGVRSGATAQPSAAQSSGKRYPDAMAYLREQRPRVVTLPGSAPIFDGRAVQANPSVACMASSSGMDASGKHQGESCHCMTEQGTRYQMPEDKCREIARFGPAYDPFKAPPSVNASSIDTAAAPPVDAPAATQTAVAVGGSQPFGTLSQYGDIGVQ